MLKRLKVSTRLAAGFGISTLLGAAIATLAIIEFKGLANSLSEVTNDRMPKMEMVQQVRSNFDLGARVVRGLALMPDAAKRAIEKKRLLDIRADNSRLLSDLDKKINLPKARAAFEEISRHRGAYNGSLDHFVQMVEAQAGNAELSSYLTHELRDAQTPLFKAVDDFLAVQRDAATSLAADGVEAANRSAKVLLGLALFTGFLGLFVAWSLTRSLRRALGAEPIQLGEVAKRVAGGDLSPMADTAQAVPGSVMASLAEMRDNLAKIVAQVRGSSDSIATGSAQIAIGNADLSQRTEQQASNLQETAASMEELSGTVKTTADTARAAERLAASAAAAAVKGGEVVGEVVSTMQEISSSSKKIGDIIGVIDGIAFQTNILALNAAVEAARAGEQGRGFAVVAGEVRSLAGRSADAAKEIKSLIGASVQRVDAGMRQVGDAGKSMGEIVIQVQQVSTAISEISNAAREQSTGIDQVGDAVTQLDQVTQQNAALVEQCATAADQLKEQSSRLAEAVRVFRLDKEFQPGAGASNALAGARPAVVQRAAPGWVAAAKPAALAAQAPTEAARAAAAPLAASIAPVASVTPPSTSDDEEWQVF